MHHSRYSRPSCRVVNVFDTGQGMKYSAREHPGLHPLRAKSGAYSVLSPRWWTRFECSSGGWPRICVVAHLAEKGPTPGVRKIDHISKVTYILYDKPKGINWITVAIASRSGIRFHSVWMVLSRFRSTNPLQPLPTVWAGNWRCHNQ